MSAAKTALALLLAILLLVPCALAQEAAVQTQWTTLGEGANEMTLVVVFPDQTTKGYHIRSNRELLLEGLGELGLIQFTQTDSGFVLTVVDDVALPADQPEAYWFIAAHDPQLDSLVPATLPLEQLPLPGQTYAIGMINGGQSHE